MAQNDYGDILNTYTSQRYNGLDRRTLLRALRPYKKQKITFARAAGKSDERLRSIAAKAVVAKFRIKHPVPKKPRKRKVTP